MYTTEYTTQQQQERAVLSPYRRRILLCYTQYSGSTTAVATCVTAVAPPSFQPYGLDVRSCCCCCSAAVSCFQERSTTLCACISCCKNIGFVYKQERRMMVCRAFFFAGKK